MAAKRKITPTSSQPTVPEQKRRKVKARENIVERPTVGGWPRKGGVLSVGDNDCGQLGVDGSDARYKLVPAKLLKDDDGEWGITSVAAGGMHSFALHSNGQLFGFGSNDEGQLGTSKSPNDGPVVVDLSFAGSEGRQPQLVQFACGASFTALLFNDGSVWATGVFCQFNGKLGLVKEGFVSKSFERIVDSERLDVAKIAVGDNHLLMLTTDGHVYSVGCSDQGQLGNIGRMLTRAGGTRERRHGYGDCLKARPVNFKWKRGSASHIVNIWAGEATSFALDKNGKFWSWGANNRLQLGIADPDETVVATPRLDENLSGLGICAVASGNAHSIFLTESGDLYSCGHADDGRLGVGSRGSFEAYLPDENRHCTAGCVAPPVRVCEPGGSIPRGDGSRTSYSMISACGPCSFAIDNEGKLYSWGACRACMGHFSVEDDDDEDLALWTPHFVQDGKLNGRRVFGLSASGSHLLVLIDVKRQN